MAFWNTGKNTIVEPYNKFKFLAVFNNFAYDAASNPLNIQYGGVYENPSKLHLAVKKIDLPKINIDFERAYANEYVHYFQNGPIHWEPMNITFIDAVSNSLNDFDDLRAFFMTYVQALTVQDNRTNIVDLPSLCEEIIIYTDSTFANADYPTLNDGKVKQQQSTLNSRGEVIERTDKVGFIESKLLTKSQKHQDGFYLIRPRLIKVDFGSMDYGSDEINEINITVVPEWCNLQLGNVTGNQLASR